MNADITSMHNETHETENKEMIVPKCDLEEWSHIYMSRLGELCGAGKPSERQIQIAKIEADAWAAKQRKAKAE